MRGETTRVRPSPRARRMSSEVPTDARRVVRGRTWVGTRKIAWGRETPGFASRIDRKFRLLKGGCKICYKDTPYVRHISLCFTIINDKVVEINERKNQRERFSRKLQTKSEKKDGLEKRWSHETWWSSWDDDGHPRKPWPGIKSHENSTLYNTLRLPVPVKIFQFKRLYHSLVYISMRMEPTVAPKFVMPWGYYLSTNATC